MGLSGSDTFYVCPIPLPTFPLKGEDKISRLGDGFYQRL
jgi:hypothetical protein